MRRRREVTWNCSTTLNTEENMSDSNESEQSSIMVEVPAHEPCSCKTTCSTKITEKRPGGCPCRTDVRKCSSHCRCGAKGKQCKNKVVLPNPIPVDDNRPSEDEERRKENEDVKKFIAELDEVTVRKIATLSLQRGIGSMDVIESLLIQEDPNAEDEEMGEFPREQDQPDQPSPLNLDPGPVPEWCKCKNCRSMPQEIENKCCGERNCVTLKRRFSKLILDPEVIQLSIKNTGDIRNDREDNSARAFRKQSYRLYILDRYTYLGKGNRKVAPSCVVLCIRRHYPSATGVYMGFRLH